MSAPRIFTPEYYAHMRWLEGLSWWNAGMRDVALGLLGLAHLPAEGIALDVGCGSGQTMAWLRTVLPGWRVQGMDVALDALRAALDAGDREVAAASALELPYPDSCANLVVTLDVLQHVPLGGGDATMLREIRRVLRTGGYLYLRTNCQMFPKTQDDAAFNFHKFIPAELRSKLESAKFRIVRLSRINAIFGLAEIPRELRARTREGSGYHGMMSQPISSRTFGGQLKRRWLRAEGSAVRAGLELPIGRTLVALAVAV
jgi:SAM-dependent methyltransferase